MAVHGAAACQGCLLSIEGTDDPHLAEGGIAREVIQALSLEPKELPTKLFYDRDGSILFEQITAQDEYYPTRCEQSIMHQYSPEIAALLGQRPLIVEYGAGSSLKTRLLLDEVDMPATYVPVDISGEFLNKSSRKLSNEYSELEVIPVTADFTADFKLPARLPRHNRRVAYCPGSTIGNQKAPQAVQMLDRMARQIGKGGYVLIGIDLVKPRDTLERAYNDAAGVTAKFNLNILNHINRRLGTNFQIANFRHSAKFDEQQNCIVMKLVSKQDAEVAVNGSTFALREGEEIITERSHKYTNESFAQLAEQASLKPVQNWTDSKGWFGVHLLEHC